MEGGGHDGLVAKNHDAIKQILRSWGARETRARHGKTSTQELSLGLTLLCGQHIVLTDCDGTFP